MTSRPAVAAMERTTNQLFAIAIAAPAVAFLFVAVRFATRWRTLGNDDYLIAVSQVMSIVLSTLVCVEMNIGFGKHANDLSSESLIMVLKFQWIVQSFYRVLITCTKLSINVLYLRIFVSNPFRTAVWTMIAIESLYCFISEAVWIFQCNPVPRAYEPSLPGMCLNLTAYFYASAAIDIITDLITLILPLTMVSTLNLPKAQKVGLMCVFAVGGFACVTGIIRMTTFAKDLESTDATYTEVTYMLWTCVHANSGIFCACLPTLGALLASILRYLLPSQVLPSTPQRHQLSTHSYAKSQRRWSQLGRGHKSKAQMTSISGIKDLPRHDSSENIILAEYAITRTTSFTVQVDDSDFESPRWDSSVTA